MDRPLVKISDVASYISQSTMAAIDVMARMNAVSGLCQCVVDEDGRFIGTLTDGDVRRAILLGADLQTPVDQFAFRDATVAHVGQSDADLLDVLQSLGSARPFVPILNSDRNVVGIVMMEPQAIMPVGLVMAGGRGTRLGKRTDTVPKPLIPVGGRPLLDRALSLLEDAGVSSVFVTAHYLSEQIESFLDARDSKAEIQVLIEEKPLGTAGGLSLLPTENRGPLVVLNADVLTDLDLSGMIAFHNRHGFDATIGVAKHTTELPFGVVDRTEDGLFSGIREKPKLTHFVASGIYLLENAFRHLISDGERLDMPELLEQGRSIGLKIGLYPIHEFWTDVGRPEELDSANDILNANGDVVDE